MVDPRQEEKKNSSSSIESSTALKYTVPPSQLVVDEDHEGWVDLETGEYEAGTLGDFSRRKECEQKENHDLEKLVVSHDSWNYQRMVAPVDSSNN